MKSCARVCLVALVTLLPFAALAATDAGVPAPTLKVGDTWTLNHVVDRGAGGFNQELRNMSIARVDSDSMLVDIKPDGSPRAPDELKIGLDWTRTRAVNEADVVVEKSLSFPLTVGKTWTVDYSDPALRGRQSNTHVKRIYTVVGWEDVTVPAGVFHALKIEDRGTLDARILIPATAASAVTANTMGGAAVTQTQRAGFKDTHETVYGLFYYVPSVKYFVKTMDEHYNGDNIRVSRETQELTSFKLVGDGGQSSAASAH